MPSLPRASADPELDRHGPEVEGLAELALQVAKVLGRQLPVREQREGGRVGRALQAVEDAGAAGRRLGLLGLDRSPG